MENKDKPGFAKLLTDVMAGYGKPLPDGPMVAVWFNMLAPFSPKVISEAFAAYASERPDFAPAPNGIAARCKLLDGRPSDDEAWSMSLLSRDEAETVIWTQEMAAAFAQCSSVLNLGDEVGARMAFKDSYNRMVASARASGTSAVWSMSQGWDVERRKVAVTRALSAGLLEAPLVRAMLPNLLPPADQQETKPEGLKKVLEALRALEDPVKKAERISQAKIDAENLRTQEIARQVKDYQKK